MRMYGNQKRSLNDLYDIQLSTVSSEKGQSSNIQTPLTRLTVNIDHLF